MSALDRMPSAVPVALASVTSGMSGAAQSAGRSVSWLGRQVAHLTAGVVKAAGACVVGLGNLVGRVASLALHAVSVLARAVVHGGHGAVKFLGAHRFEVVIAGAVVGLVAAVALLVRRHKASAANQAAAAE